MDSDQKTAVIRCVPLDSPTEVSDDGKTSYREVWKPGAFDGLRPQKTVLQRHHGSEPANIFGICRGIHEVDGMVEGEFEYLDDAPIAGLARQLMREGAWEFASVSVLMKRDGTHVHTDGLVERRRVADFRHLAIVDRPAYPQAKVLAVRHDLAAIRAELDVIRSVAKQRPRH